MEEENKTTTAETDYIEKLTELQANSVSKAEYEKLRADNKRLLDAMFSGTTVPVEEPKPEEPQVDIQALRNELYGGHFDGTDLEYTTKVLQLRKAIMATGAPDPAVCNGIKTEATEYDYENAQSICDQLQEVVDYAQGDPGVFRAELLRRTNTRK